MISRYLHTLKYLKWLQLVFLLARRFKLKKFLLKRIDANCLHSVKQFYPSTIARSSFNGLNLQYSFEDVLNGAVEQKLYLYNFFYMNDYKDKQYLFLHAQCYKTKSIFLEPYPTSLRIVNVLYYSSLKNREVVNYLAKDLELLSLSIEYELDGNHLLENLLALSLYEVVIGRQGRFTREFARQLENQFIDFEWHFEQSPMYQAILLERIQCYLAIATSVHVEDTAIIELCGKIVTKGVAYLQLFHVRGIMLHFNDSTGGNSLSVQDLVNNNRLLNLTATEPTHPSKLLKNGFARMEGPGYELVVDTSKILADHIPGHIHSATGTFWLFRDQKPFIINNAISTYQEGDIRNLERGSSFHNCIAPRTEFNEVWGCFRVGRRVSSEIDQGEGWVVLRAKLLTGESYSRTFTLDERLIITDMLQNCGEEVTAYLYFDESVSPELITKHVHSSNIYCIDAGNVPIEYHKSVPAHFIYYKFKDSNIVTIQ